MRRAYSALATVSHGYSDLRGRFLTCYSPVRRSPRPESRFSLDLHVLSAPPAFVLSQDQTLQYKESHSALSNQASNEAPSGITRCFPPFQPGPPEDVSPPPTGPGGSLPKLPLAHSDPNCQSTARDSLSHLPQRPPGRLTGPSRHLNPSVSPARPDRRASLISYPLSDQPSRTRVKICGKTDDDVVAGGPPI